MTDDALLDRFSWWYVPRRQGRFIRRNLLVAAGNSGEHDALAIVSAHTKHPSSMIRGHAYWAMARGFGGSPRREALDTETVPEARDELMLALLMVEHPEAYSLVLDAEEEARGRSEVRGLALVGPHASGEGRGRDDLRLVFVDGDSGAVDRLDESLVRVYDPDRILEQWRRILRLGVSTQP
jgi:hypothetical protein